MDIDDLWKELGEFGRFQKCLCFLIFCCFALSSVNNMGIVLIAGVPEHWCHTPDIHGLNLSTDVIKNLTIPLEEGDGIIGYSSCFRYRRNYTGWTTEDALEELSRNRTGYHVEECKDGWVYDTSVYISTTVSEVRCLISRSSCNYRY